MESEAATPHRQPQFPSGKIPTNSTANNSVDGSTAARLVKLRLGSVVTRNPTDWQWDDQDGGEGNEGMVTELLGGGWVRVKWKVDNFEGAYRWGAEDAIDLILTEKVPLATAVFNEIDPDGSQHLPILLLVDELKHNKAVRSILKSHLNELNNEVNTRRVNDLLQSPHKLLALKGLSISDRETDTVIGCKEFQRYFDKKKIIKKGSQRSSRSNSPSVMSAIGRQGRMSNGTTATYNASSASTTKRKRSRSVTQVSSRLYPGPGGIPISKGTRAEVQRRIRRSSSSSSTQAVHNAPWKVNNPAPDLIPVRHKFSRSMSMPTRRTRRDYQNVDYIKEDNLKRNTNNTSLYRSLSMINKPSKGQLIRNSSSSGFYSVDDNTNHAVSRPPVLTFCG